MLKIKNIKTIEVQDWDKLVQETYGKPYSFQQQDGCKERGNFDIDIPSKYSDDEDMNDSIPEEVNGEKMGVKFAVWLARDPKEPLKNDKDKEGGKKDQWRIDLFWERNFYPDVHEVANDLHKKGLIEAGEYRINIDW
jgi:hypothetical protein